MRKLGPESLSRAQTLSLINSWLSDKLAAESKSAQDLADCMRVFAEHGRDLSQAIAYAEHILKADGKTLLTTGHKAKGLEWDNVLHLDPWLVRQVHNQQNTKLDYETHNASNQNKNLDYVISTRSANHLLEVDSEAISWTP
jgi:superfamily I DNA/RNA helicase